MRVIHYCDQFSILTQTFVYDSIVELQRLGVDNHVITRRRINESARPFPSVHILTDLNRVQRLVKRFLGFPRTKHSDPNDWMRPSWPLRRRRVIPILKKLSPDLLHAHFGPEAGLIGPVARDLGIPFIVTFYGYDVSKLPGDPIWRETYLEMWPYTSRAIVLSEHMKRSVLNLGCPEHLVSTVRLGRNLRGLHVKTNQPPVARFISVGRLVEKKGHADMLKAFSIAALKAPNIRLEIIGEGPRMEEISSLVASLGLKEKVAVLGALPSEKVLERMSQADAFLLTCKTSRAGDEEGTPTVLIEAQNLGLPCVSTFHAGIPEMIPHQNHFLLSKEGDIEGIANAISRLANFSPEQVSRIAQDGFDYVRANFDLEKETTKLQQIYTQATQGKRAIAR